MKSQIDTLCRLLDSEPDVRRPVTSGGLCLHLLLVTNETVTGEHMDTARVENDANVNVL